MKINSEIEGEINKCVQALRRGEYVVFPDETGWSIGCDVQNAALVKKILDSEKYISPAILLDEAGRLNKYLKVIPDTLWDLVEFSTRPMDIILGNVVNLPGVVMNEAGESTFRIVKDAFSQIMTHKFGKPVFAAQLNDQIKPVPDATGILNTPAYVVNLRIGAKSNPGSLVIIRLSTGGRIEFIKK